VVFSPLFASVLYVGELSLKGDTVWGRSKTPAIYWLVTLLLFSIAALSAYHLVHGLLTGEFPR
jgi:hypothetical protein